MRRANDSGPAWPAAALGLLLVLLAAGVLVVALADGSTLVWEYLTNHQIEPAAAAIEAALDELD